MQFSDAHTPITDKQQILDLLKKTNEEIHSVGLYFKWDKKDEVGFTSWPDDQMPEHALIVLASFDMTYYHQMEFAFFDVLAHDMPDEFQWPDHWEKEQLVLLEGREREDALAFLNIPHPESHYVFAFNIGSHGEEQYYILASGISIFRGTVFYYDREKQEALKEGERVAWWTRRE
ncbi:MAG: hypothetical protein R2794_01120 [Chitinophagales bacterium]